jgi:hypothetical protein
LATSGRSIAAKVIEEFRNWTTSCAGTSNVSLIQMQDAGWPYYLFKAIDNKLAWLLVALFAISIPISVLNELNQIAALTLLHDIPFLFDI